MFRSLSDIDQFPKIFCNSSKFLSYIFKHFIASNVSYLYKAYPIPKLIDKFFLFITIPNNRLFLFLNEFFFNDDGY